MASKVDREDNGKKREDRSTPFDSGWSIARQTNGENFINFEAVVYT